ncbi:MAG: hypothetical protein WC635_03335 [Bacteriovorax sp.]|jgi:hypothetical protein
MKTSLILISLLGVMTGCKALKALDSVNATPEKMDETLVEIRKSNDGISSTNESIRLQKLILSKNDMLDEKNTENLEPVALGMIAGAKKFGEAATSEELIEYTRVLLLQIKKEKPDDSLKDENGKYPAKVIAAYDHQKMINMSQIYTIAGFCPQEKVDQIINDQIFAGGLYQKTAYIFLMARVQFIGTYLQETLLGEPIDTVKIMKETITRLGSIDYILKLPFKAKVGMKIDGFLGKDALVASLYDETGKMDDSWNAPKLWKKVLKRFDQELKDGNIVEGSSSKTTAVQQEIADLKATVMEYIESWK